MYWLGHAFVPPVNRSINLCEYPCQEAGLDLHSLIRVQAERTGSRGRRQHSVRYYIPAIRSMQRSSRTSAWPLAGTLWVEERSLYPGRAVPGGQRPYAQGNAPAVMGILHRAALNKVRTMQRHLETDGSIGLLRDRIGRQPWFPVSTLP